MRVSDGGRLTLRIFPAGRNFQEARKNTWTSFDLYELEGRPVQEHMPPMWSLGLQVGAQVYQGEQEFEAMYLDLLQKIPFDTILHGADYMDGFKMFKENTCKYANMKIWVDLLHASNKKYVVAMHPSWDVISADKADPGSLSDHHFIRQGSSSSQTDANYFGYQWATKVSGCDQQIQDPAFFDTGLAEPCYYFDFFNEGGQNEYKLEFQKFFNETNVKFDGVFLELNEPADFNPDQDRCGSNLNSPSYLPIGIIDLNEGNVCGNALHEDGKGNDVQHFLKHNHYGRAQSRATHEAIPKGHRFPIYSHSVSEGIGAFAGSWQTETKFNNNWEDLVNALVNVLDLSLYHIGQSTSPACGTIGDVHQNLEICSRWTQLSAFFPTFRFWNSNYNQTIERYPTMFGDEFIQNVLPAIRMRYSLLPYLYSNFYYHYTNGDAVVSSVSERFNDLKFAQAGSEGYEQFMFGPSLMIVPVLNGPEDTGDKFLQERVKFTKKLKKKLKFF